MTCPAPWATDKIPEFRRSHTMPSLRFSSHLNSSRAHPAPTDTGLNQLQGMRALRRSLPGRMRSAKVTRDPQVVHSYNVFEKDTSDWQGLHSQRLEKERSSLNSANFYTALTRRTPRGGAGAGAGEAGAGGWNALTQPSASIPQFLDPPGGATLPRRDISEWRRQVIKEVEGRPDYAVPAARLPRRQFELSGDYEDVIQGPQPAFYHARPAPPARTYQVNPEWLSERVHMHRSRAFQSSGLVMPFGA